MQQISKMKMTGKSKRLGAALLAALLLLIAFSGIALAQENPTPVQTYFVPMPEHDAFRSMNTSEAAARLPITGTTSIAIGADNTWIYYDQWENGYDSVISNPLLYDQSTNPLGTQIWGNGICSDGFPPNRNGGANVTSCTDGPTGTDILRSGNVIVLRSGIPEPQAYRTGHANGNEPAGTHPHYYDGGDKFASSEQVAVARLWWGLGGCSTTAGAGTCLAGSVEVYPTSRWGTQYRSPVGANSPLEQATEYSALEIQAAVDDTLVQVDVNNNGSFGDSVDINVTLDEGQAVYVGQSRSGTGEDPTGTTFTGTAISQGARVQSTGGPVQVNLLTGDRGQNVYEYRTYALIPEHLWSNNYWSPVSGKLAGHTDSPGTYETAVIVYNPKPSPGNAISVTCEGTEAPITKSINGQAIGTFVVTINSGVNCYTANVNDKFIAIANIDYTGSTGTAADDNGGTYDWQYTLVPADQLDSMALVGFGAGYNPNRTSGDRPNGSPVWVTPTENTRLFVDIDGDGCMDAFPNVTTAPWVYNVTRNPSSPCEHAGGLLVPKLRSIRIFNTTTALSNQTGVQLFSANNAIWGNHPNEGAGIFFGPGADIAVAWGESPMHSPGADPGFDAGTNVNALRGFSVSKGYAIPGGGSVITQGGEFTYTVEIRNTGSGQIKNIVVTDTLPSEVSLVTPALGTMKVLRYNTNGAFVSSTNVPVADQNKLIDGTGLQILAPTGGVLSNPLLPKVRSQAGSVGERLVLVFRVQASPDLAATCDATIVNSVIVRVDEKKTDSATVYTPCEAQLTIIKKVVGPGGVSFPFTFQRGAVTAPFNLTPLATDGTDKRDFANLPIGQQVTVSEGALPANWAFTSAVCAADVGVSNFTTTGQQVQGTLTANQKVTCTFTNTIKTGTLTVTKKVSGVPSGVTPGSFEICLTHPTYPIPGDACKTVTIAEGQTTNSVSWPNLWAGSGYVVTESTGLLPAGLWTVSGSGVGVTVAPGANAHEITNAYNPGVLTIEKTASARINRSYTWTLEKDDGPAVHYFDGEMFTLPYTIIAKRTTVDVNTLLTGTITVRNTGPGIARVNEPTDTPSVGTVTDVQCKLNNSDNVIADGAYPVTLQKDDTLNCTYESTAPFGGTWTGSGYTNNASVTRTDGALPTTKSVTDFPITVNKIEDKGKEELTVSDPEVSPSTHTFAKNDAIQEWKPSTPSQSCADYGVTTYTDGHGSATHTNTVTGTDANSDLSDTATTQVNCYQLQPSKDAQTKWTRNWTWTLEKAVSQNAVTLPYPQSATLFYSVTVEPTPQSTYLVTGTVSVRNPAPSLSATVSKQDLIALTAGGTTPVTFTQCNYGLPGDATHLIPGGETLTCDYEAVSTSSAAALAGTNQFTVTQLINGLPIKTYTPATAPVAFGSTPDVENNASITVTDVLTKAGIPAPAVNLGNTAASQGEKEFNYQVNVCDATDWSSATGDAITYVLNNRADIKDAVPPVFDTETVSVTCWKPNVLVTKTADGSYTQPYTWTVTKTVEPDTLNLFDGQTGELKWTVKADKSPLAPKAYEIHGSVKIENKSLNSVTINSVVDKTNDDISIDLVSCEDQTGASVTNLAGTVLAPNAWVQCSYTSTDAGLSHTSTLRNTVTVVTSHGSFDVEEEILWAAPKLENDQVTLSDPLIPSIGGVIGDDVEYTSVTWPTSGVGCYDTNVTWDDLLDWPTGDSERHGTIQNTVSILPYDPQSQNPAPTPLDSDNATAQVNCYRLLVKKDATPDLSTSWEITKNVSPKEVNLFNGQSATFNYTVTVTKTQDFGVTGTFSVTNTAPQASGLVANVSVVDDLPGATVSLINCGVSGVLAIQPGTTATCGYTADFTSTPAVGAMLTNTVHATQDLGGSATKVYSGTAAFTMPPTIDEVTVADDRYTLSDATTKTTKTWTYTQTPVCGQIATPWVNNGDGSYTLTNTASITTSGAKDSATQTVKVNCYQVTAAPSCVADAPVISWKLIGPDAASKKLTLDWMDGANVLASVTNLNGEGSHLWYGANTTTGAVGGTGNQWPGWTQTGGVWNFTPNAVNPTGVVRFSFNPTSDPITVVYPPSNPTCSTGPRAALGDLVWLDTNANGVQDSGEVGVAGVEVKLHSRINGVEQPVLTTSTNASGIYTFTNLMGGDVVSGTFTGPVQYAVEFGKPNGYIRTSDNIGNDELDSDADEVTGFTTPFTLAAGAFDRTRDAGLFQASILLDKRTVFNENGLHLVGDGITIPYLSQNVSWAYTVTNTSGMALVDVIVTDNKVASINCPKNTLAPNESMVCTATGAFTNGNYQNTGVVTGTVPGAGEGSQPLTKVTASDTSNYTCEGTVLTGIVFYDDKDLAFWDPAAYQYKVNNAAVLPSNPSLLNLASTLQGRLMDKNIMVTLSRVENGVEVEQYAQQLKNGRFYFDQSLLDPAGTYTLHVEDGPLQTLGFAPSTNDSSLRFNVKPQNCATIHHAFGYIPVQGLIGDLVWYDVNANGLQDEWYDANGNGVVDQNGPGNVDSNGYVTVPLNEYEYIEIDGIPGPTLEGELNKCGLRSVGPTLELLGADGEVLDSTIAGNNGYYRFRFENETTKAALSVNGTYSVRLVDLAENQGLRNGLLDQYVANKCRPLPNAPEFSIANFVPIDGVQSAGEGQICGVTTSVSNSTNLNAAPNHVDLTLDYAGVCISPRGGGSSSIGDRFWMDEDKDGIQDPGEPGVAGVTVNLYIVTGGVGGGGAGTLVATMKTDANGNYRFNGLDAGTYYIQFVLPNGVVVSPQNSGGDDAVDSDIDQTGRTANVTLGMLEVNLTVDGGVYIAPTNDPDDPNGEPNVGEFTNMLWLPTISNR